MNGLRIKYNAGAPVSYPGIIGRAKSDHVPANQIRTFLRRNFFFGVFRCSPSTSLKTQERAPQAHPRPPSATDREPAEANVAEKKRKLKKNQKAKSLYRSVLRRELSERRNEKKCETGMGVKSRKGKRLN